MNLRTVLLALLLLLPLATSAQDSPPEAERPAPEEPAEDPTPEDASPEDSNPEDSTPEDSAPPSAEEPEEDLRETVRRLEERLKALEGEQPAEEEGSSGPGVLQRVWDSLEIHAVGVASYGYNLIDPDQRRNANRFRVSDLDHDSFTPNFFKLGIQKPLSGKNEFDAGLRIEVAAGSSVEDYLSLDPQFLGGEEINLANAYVEVQLATLFGRPLTVRFGRSYGWFGLDSCDLYDAPLFTMSWFGNYTPFTNTGLFLEMEVIDGLTVMQYVGNGSEFVVDNNDAKTVGGRIAYTGQEGTSLSGWTFAFNWIWGAERDENVHDNRFQLELDVVWKPHDAAALYLMVHYGQEEGQDVTGGGVAKFGGASLALNYGIWEAQDEGGIREFGKAVGASETYQRVSILQRATYYRDHGGANSGLDQTLYELSGGIEVKPTSFSWIRVEYRHDFSNRGTAFLGHRGGATRRDQGTVFLAVGMGF